LRGRTAEEIINLLKEGIESVNPSLPYKIIPHENEAIDYAYENCPKDGLVTIMCDVVAGALDKISSLKQKEDAESKGVIKVFAG
ncbi:MAG TPA: hypothetical protein VGD33_00525, partial [Chitinophagaceae bacterium]